MLRRALNAKLTLKIFFGRRPPKQGEGGGGPTLGKNSQIISFFFDGLPYNCWNKCKVPLLASLALGANKKSTVYFYFYI